LGGSYIAKHTNRIKGVLKRWSRDVWAWFRWVVVMSPIKNLHGSHSFWHHWTPGIQSLPSCRRCATRAIRRRQLFTTISCQAGPSQMKMQYVASAKCATNSHI
jgi:hypothetical protein